MPTVKLNHFSILFYFQKSQLQTMEKLLLILSLIAVLVTITNSAPLQQNSKLISSIEEIQRKYSNVDESAKTASGSRSVKSESDDDENEEGDSEDHGKIVGYGLSNRQNKMFPFYSPFYSYPSQASYPSYPSYPSQFYYPPEFYEDFAAYYGGYGAEEEEIMSRTNAGPRRRPAGNFKNSPIYYIRLPPTPYMFVPGFGYISQPPTYSTMVPPPPPPPVSPFYNLPVNFLANGKPTNIYQFGAPAAAPQFGYPYPQTPVPPMRPQRPYQRPMNMNPYLQDSKVTHLKGPFVFNGRPEEIFLLQNSFNSLYSDPRFANPYY